MQYFRDTLQHRQKDVEVVTRNLELERAKNHHLLTEVGLIKYIHQGSTSRGKVISY